MTTTRSTRSLPRRTFLRLAAAATAFAMLPMRLFAGERPMAAFGAVDQDEVFAALGGTPTLSADIDLQTPDIAENGAVVPVGVESRIPGTTRMFIVVEMNPNPLAATFEIPEGSDAWVQTRVKVAQTCMIHGIAEAGGKLYMASRETKVTLGGCGG